MERGCDANLLIAADWAILYKALYLFSRGMQT